MKKSDRTKPEDTDLERRVLALERVLKSLIVHVARSEPAFLDDLAETFVVPMGMERREHDFVDTDSRAERVIRAATQLGAQDADLSQAGGRAASLPALQARMIGRGSALVSPVERVRTTFRNGIWTVVVDGAFAGDYTDREQAEAAAARERHVPR